MQINITESSSPPNAATIDRPDLNLDGNTFSKTEVLEKIGDQFNYSLKGTATPTTVPTQYDATTYPNGLLEKYDVYVAGTFTNFITNPGVQGAIPVEITAEDIKDNFVFIYVTNGVSKKQTTSKKGIYQLYLATTLDNPKKTEAEFILSIKGASNIPNWEAIGYPQYAMTVKDNQIWQSQEVVLNTDIPNVSSKWKSIGGDTKNLDIILKYFLNNNEFQEEKTLADATLGLVLNKNFTEASNNNPTTATILKTDLQNSDFVYFNFYTQATSAIYVNNYVCLSFERLDGTYYHYKSWTVSPVQDIIDETFDLRGGNYKNVTVTFDTNGVFSLKKYKLKIEIDAIKKFIDLKSKSAKSITKSSDTEKLFVDLNLSKDFVFNVNSANETRISVLNSIDLQDNTIFNIKLNFTTIPTVFKLPDSFKFINDVAPIFVNNSTYILVCQTYDFGITWFVSVVGVYPFNNKILAFDDFKKIGAIDTTTDGKPYTLTNPANNNGILLKSVLGSFIIIDTNTTEYTIALINDGTTLNTNIIWNYKSPTQHGWFGFEGDVLKVGYYGAAFFIADISKTIVGNINELKVVIKLASLSFYVNDVLVYERDNANGNFQGIKKSGFYVNNAGSKIKSLKISKNE